MFNRAIMKQVYTDIPLLIITLLLITTLAAFFIGLFPYPFGFVILSFVLLGRLLQLTSMK